MGVNSYTNRYLCKNSCLNPLSKEQEEIHVLFEHGSELENMGIKHVFSCINICRVQRMLFEHEADRPSVQHHPRDLASVNAMKQTCVIVILA